MDRVSWKTSPSSLKIKRRYTTRKDINSRFGKMGMSKNGLISLRVARNQKIRNNSNEASGIISCIFFNGNSKWAYWNIPNFSWMWDISTQQNQKVLLGNIEAYLLLSFNIFSVLLYVPRVAFTLFFRFVFFGGSVNRPFLDKPNCVTNHQFNSRH